jgi:hypothetical protein
LLHARLAHGRLTPADDQKGAGYREDKERLSVTLDIPLKELERYLNGERMPQEVFIQALDIVAGRPVHNKPNGGPT